jgi:hypothetical protein
MASGKITKRSVDSLISTGAEGILWDDSLKGFGAKITKSGAVSYILQFRMGGREARTRRYTIGSHGSPWTPTTARDEAQRISLLIAQGIDPSKLKSSAAEKRSIWLSTITRIALRKPASARDGGFWLSDRSASM